MKIYISNRKKINKEKFSKTAKELYPYVYICYQIELVYGLKHSPQNEGLRKQYLREVGDIK